jgi:uncharacterized protein (DUF2336 family)
MTIPLSLIDELESALSSGTNEKRLQALWRVTDLFISGENRYTDEQIGLFDSVIGKLAAAIESKARAKLASRLAQVANAPGNVIRSLAADDNIDVARPILSLSERLEEADLVVTAQNKGQQHLAAIARRQSLSETITDLLVTRGNKQVVHSVARNAGARFSDAGFRMLVKRSVGDDELASHVGKRPDLPRHHFLALLDKASASVKDKLVAANPEAAATVDGVVGEIVVTLRSEARNASRDYTLAKAKVEALFRQGRLGELEIYGFARERHLEDTSVALSLLCQVSMDVVERAFMDAGHEVALILCRAAGLSSTTAKAILLLRTADRGMSAQDLDQALTTYGRLQIETARRVLGFYDARQRRSPDPVAVA